MLSINGDMDTIIRAVGHDNLFENAPFSKESKEAMIDHEFQLIRKDPYIAGRWLEACREDAPAVKILEELLKDNGVSDYGLWVLKNYNNYNKTLSNAVFTLADILINTFKTYQALGDGQELLTDDEKFEVLEGTDIFGPDAETCDKIMGLLSDKLKEMIEDYLDSTNPQEDSGDLAVLALALDVGKDPIEWMNIVSIYDSKKFGENTSPVIELNEIIGGYFNGKS